MKRTAFFLPTPLLKLLKALSERTDMPVSEHVRRALEEYLQRTKSKGTP